MPLNIDIQQILLHALNFVILFGALYFLLYNPVKQFIEKRNDYYDELDKKSEDSTKEIESIKNEYAQKIADLDNSKTQIVLEAREKAKKEADRIIDNAHEEAEVIISKAKVLAAKEKDKAIKDANYDIRSLAEEAAKILTIDGKDAYESFVDSFNNNDKAGN